MSRPSGPGKTAPKLSNDALLFSPLNAQTNILADHTPPLGEGPRLAPAIGSCSHEYKTKFEQSAVPPLDIRPDGSSQYRVAAVCKKCQVHVDIHINYDGASDPCPTSDFPLHHFQRVRDEDVKLVDRISYSWCCSAPRCGAILQIAYRKPRLTKDDYVLLTQPELLRKRFEDVKRKDPERDGLRQAMPMEVLQRLRRYITDALNPSHERRVFPANNKRFMEAFGYHGEDCRLLLERIGFAYDDGTVNWLLPNPAVLDDRLQADGTSLREVLEDVQIELLALMYNTAVETAAVNPAADELWTSANRDIERLLQAQGYARHSTLRRWSVSHNEREYYASLGALELFHDSLIEFAYERQTLVDPQNAPYYLECLQAITEHRHTEQLQMKVSMLASQGQVSRRDINAAWRNLGILPNEQNISDEMIVQRLNARLPDLGQSAAREARQALHTIGTLRNSQTLIKASQQTIETYEEALTWLGNGVDKDTPDDGLITVFAVRAADSPENVEIGRRAISIIARERKSEMLNNWLITGRSDGYTMALDDALRHLGITGSLDSVDPTVFPMVFSNARVDRPGDLTEKAISTVQKALSQPGAGGKHSPETWPVGLVSHGNTCYLNSLLQYYFSIKEFRDIVLNYDSYKLDITPFEQEPTKKKEQRVGGLQRSLEVIKGAQYFAQDLKHLFERMIKEPGTAVRPDTDLVCRAFLKPEDWALLDKKAQSTAAQNEQAGNKDEKTPVTGTEQGSSTSMASSQTLQADDMMSSQILPPLEEVRDKDVKMENGEMPPTPPASPGQKPRDAPLEPAHAPPLPPRHEEAAKNAPLALAEKNAREQQDVTEVHDAALDRLRIGMTPQGVDNEGEQVDGLRSLFVIDMTETPVKKGVPGKSRPAPTTAVQVNVPEPNEAIDIYSALDGFFDSQTFEDDPTLESYKSLRTFPPLFQISIPRAGYDKKTGAFFKSNGCVKLEDELYLDRYSDDSDPEILPVRKECWALRKQLNGLKKERRELNETPTGLNKPSTIEQTANFVKNVAETGELLEEIGLEKIDVPEDLSSTLATDADHFSQRKTELDVQIDSFSKKLEGRFDTMKKIKYRLAAVFIHRGSQGGGHYWIYIHDFANDIWRTYNDESVEEFKHLEHMYEARGGSNNAAPPHGTPTYAVYVRDELRDKLIEPVRRDPEEVPQPDNQISSDVSMKGSGTQTAHMEQLSNHGWDKAQVAPPSGW